MYFSKRLSEIFSTSYCFECVKDLIEKKRTTYEKKELFETKRALCQLDSIYFEDVYSR